MSLPARLQVSGRWPAFSPAPPRAGNLHVHNDGFKKYFSRLTNIHPGIGRLGSAEETLDYRRFGRQSFNHGDEADFWSKKKIYFFFCKNSDENQFCKKNSLNPLSDHPGQAKSGKNLFFWWLWWRNALMSIFLMVHCGREEIPAAPQELQARTFSLLFFWNKLIHATQKPQRESWV